MAALTKRKLLRVFKTQADIARKLDIGTPYVSRWPIDGPIPKFQELRLRHEVMPEINWDEIARNRA